MALHGDIRVNGHIIGVWSATRRQPLGAITQISDYDCEVYYSAPRHEFTFEVRHRYDEGAEALISKLLDKARRLRLLEEGR